jgi:hypothetical protein
MHAFAPQIAVIATCGHWRAPVSIAMASGVNPRSLRPSGYCEPDPERLASELIRCETGFRIDHTPPQYLDQDPVQLDRIMI